MSEYFSLTFFEKTKKRTLNVEGSITVRLVSSFTGLDCN